MIICCLMTTNEFDFVDWLNTKLENLQWSQADLAKRARLNKSVISRIMSRERKATPETLVAIAKAINLPPETVFREAGLLPPKLESDKLTNEAEFLLSQLPEHRRRQAVEFIRYLAEKQGDDTHAAAAPMENSQEP